MAYTPQYRSGDLVNDGAKLFGVMQDAKAQRMSHELQKEELELRRAEGLQAANLAAAQAATARAQAEAVKTNADTAAGQLKHTEKVYKEAEEERKVKLATERQKLLGEQYKHGQTVKKDDIKNRVSNANNVYNYGVSMGFIDGDGNLTEEGKKDPVLQERIRAAVQNDNVLGSYILGGERVNNKSPIKITDVGGTGLAALIVDKDGNPKPVTQGRTPAAEGGVPEVMEYGAVFKHLASFSDAMLDERAYTTAVGGAPVEPELIQSTLPDGTVDPAIEEQNAKATALFEREMNAYKTGLATIRTGGTLVDARQANQNVYNGLPVGSTPENINAANKTAYEQQNKKQERQDKLDAAEKAAKKAELARIRAENEAHNKKVEAEENAADAALYGGFSAGQPTGVDGAPASGGKSLAEQAILSSMQAEGTLSEAQSGWGNIETPILSILSNPLQNSWGSEDLQGLQDRLGLDNLGDAEGEQALAKFIAQDTQRLLRDERYGPAMLEAMGLKGKKNLTADDMAQLGQITLKIHKDLGKGEVPTAEAITHAIGSTKNGVGFKDYKSQKRWNPTKSGWKNVKSEPGREISGDEPDGFWEVRVGR